MAQRKGVAIGIVVAALLVACAACFAYCKSTGQAGSNGKSILDALHDDGYGGTLSDWADSLTDEQKAAIDIAYESSVASGFTGSKEEWLSKEPTARHGSSGNLIISLPDGGELTVPSGAWKGADEAGSETGSKAESGAAHASSASQPDGASSSDGSRAADSRQTETSEGQPGGEGGEGAGRAYSASETPAMALTVDEVEARAGDDGVLVSVRISNNPGILGLTLSLSYDDSALSLEGAESGEAFGDELAFTHSRLYEPGCVFTWDGVELTPDAAKDGSILNLYFKVADGAAKGNYPVVVHGGDPAITGGLEEVDYTVQNGSVTIE